MIVIMLGMVVSYAMMLVIVIMLGDGCQLCYDAGDCYYAWGWLSVVMLMIVIMLGDGYQLSC